MKIKIVYIIILSFIISTGCASFGTLYTPSEQEMKSTSEKANVKSKDEAINKLNHLLSEFGHIPYFSGQGMSYTYKLSKIDEHGSDWYCNGAHDIRHVSHCGATIEMVRQLPLFINSCIVVNGIFFDGYKKEAIEAIQLMNYLCQSEL